MTELGDELEEQRERARAAREALVGKTIAGRYVLRGLVGHGGMGAVYEAEHLGLGKRVAIKFVDPEFATDEKVVARFSREARAMSAMESAHIVTVFDAGTEDGRPYLVMELLRGEDLGQRLRRMKRVPLTEAMHVTAQVLKGLARAHGAGIIHRDLKPDNVFLVKHDTDPLFAKIVDFGISKIERPRSNTSSLALTGRGTVLGTPFYMSPEQAQASSDVDGRTDLYSVGAILFECLTGRPPHTGESYEQIILSICMRDSPTVRSYDPAIPKDVSAFIARALTRDRAQRFLSAEKMLAALHEVAPEEQRRVPLDPPSARALEPEAKLSDATVLDHAVPRGAQRPSRPSDEVSAATRFGVGSLDDTSLDVIAPAVPVEERAPAQRVLPKDGWKPVAPSPRPSSKKRGAGAQRRPVGAVLLTAGIATLLGVGVTFGVISILEKNGPHQGAATSATARPIVASAIAATVSASAVPPSVMDASATTPVISALTPKPVAPRPSGALPRPSSTKPLDIQRDLP